MNTLSGHLATFLAVITLMTLGIVVAHSPSSAAQSAPPKPLMLPFKEPPGADTWLLGQTYGNTTGAFRRRDTTYGASQGIRFGIDFSVPCGTELVAMADGVVYAADVLNFGSAPHNLLIDHPELGYTVLYGHLLERPQLQPGQTGRVGDVVALSGDPAGTCSGRPHLHLEVRDSSNRARKFNPVLLIQADWDDLALVGSFSRGFQYDLDDPCRWQHLDKQPEAVSGGRLLNDFANPWPPDRNGP